MRVTTCQDEFGTHLRLSVSITIRKFKHIELNITCNLVVNGRQLLLKIFQTFDIRVSV